MTLYLVKLRQITHLHVLVASENPDTRAIADTAIAQALAFPRPDNVAFVTEQPTHVSTEVLHHGPRESHQQDQPPRQDERGSSVATVDTSQIVRAAAQSICADAPGDTHHAPGYTAPTHSDIVTTRDDLPANPEDFLTKQFLGYSGPAIAVSVGLRGMATRAIQRGSGASGKELRLAQAFFEAVESIGPDGRFRQMVDDLGRGFAQWFYDYRTLGGSKPDVTCIHLYLLNGTRVVRGKGIVPLKTTKSSAQAQVRRDEKEWAKWVSNFAVSDIHPRNLARHRADVVASINSRDRQLREIGAETQRLVFERTMLKRAMIKEGSTPARKKAINALTRKLNGLKGRARNAKQAVEQQQERLREIDAVLSRKEGSS